MSVDKTIKLTRSDGESITVSSGTDTFTITFFEVPRVSDNAERRFQRVRKPREDVNETIESSPGPHNFRFTIYGSPAEGNAKDKKKQKQGSRSHFLAIKDDKAFAIRLVGDCKESAFKVKVWVGGVNVLQHTTHGKKSQGYFVVSEQKWIWGKQVGEDTARQFRVFRRGRERLSLQYQLRKNNIKKEIEIEITSRRLDQPTWSYLPPPPTDMTLDDSVLSVTYIPSIMPQQVRHSTPPPCISDTDHIEQFSYDDMAPTPQAAFQEPSSDDTVSPTQDSSQPPEISPASTSDDTNSSDPMSNGYSRRSHNSSSWARFQFRRKITSLECRCMVSYSRPYQAVALRPSPESESLRSEPLPLVAGTPVYEQASVPVAAPQAASGQESIHSDPEEDMLPRQMVVGTGGLIEQIVCPDKHPEWIDDDIVKLKFKIVSDPRYLPKHLQNLEEPEESAGGGMRIRGTGPGGNYREVPNPPTGIFGAHAPVVTDPDGLRRDIRSPMEMELSVNGHGEPLEPPEESGDESVRQQEEGGREPDDGGEEGQTRRFQALWEEAGNQPRGFRNNIRMKKREREQRKRGGVGLMADK